MLKELAVFAGRIISKISRTFNLGAGVTWAGEIALKLDPNILPKLIPADSKVILIAGTNGKTTTSKMIKFILKDAVSNDTGANILNGIVGTLITLPAAKYIILETDEATLPIVTAQIKPEIIVLLNLFRDQLDRYGEVDTIAQKWQKSLSDSSKKGCTLIVNGEDPQLAWLGKNLKNVQYFGLDNPNHFQKKMEHATDSIYCPNCGSRLNFSGTYFSHLGKWNCPQCQFSTPKLNLTSNEIQSPLPGTYNLYNTLAATLVCKTLGASDTNLANFSASFGRLEELDFQGKKVTVLLSKNPTGFNQSLRTTLKNRSSKNLLLVLNDRIPDGRDVSWIWDVDFETVANYSQLMTVSGDRAFDLGLRLKYAGVTNLRIQANLNKAIQESINEAEDKLWILATYSAMLDVRKILTGRKIL